MATRNKIDANKSVFAGLDRFCTVNGEVLSIGAGARWIVSEKGSDVHRLVKADLTSFLSMGPSLKVARFDVDGVGLFCSLGLELSDEIPGLHEEVVGGGMLTAVLSELSPTPIVSALEVRNIIETDSLTLGYKGHEAYEIAPLFPLVKIFSGADISQDETSRIFFLICLADSIRSGTWMDRGLKSNLQLIAELSSIAIPYRILCRSLFDTDPSAVFLALYRCLEALYAYSHTTDLILKLKMDHEWDYVARILEETLAWRPREEPSLGALLQNAVSSDLKAMIEALGENLPPGADLVNFATKKMYNLRNSLVHYRAFHHSFDPESVDWNRLCEATALMVLHIYASIVSK